MTTTSYPTTDYTASPNLNLYLPTPGVATSWGSMFNDSFLILDQEVQDLKNIAHVQVTKQVTPQNYLVFDQATQQLTANAVNLASADVTGQLPWASISGAPTAVSHWTNDSGYITSSNNLGDLADAATAKGNLGLSTLATTAEYADLNNAPVLHTVATTGDYTTLNNLPDLSLKADLVSGKIPVSQIPAIAISEFLGAVGTEAAMLALGGQQGDWCNRADTGTTWVRTGSGSTISDWMELQYPGDSVTSVNGQTGTVVLSFTDVQALPATTYIPTSGTDFDPVGTDNSVNVTLSGAYDYLSISGQQITLGQVDLTTDVTGKLPVANMDGLAAVATSGSWNDLANQPTNVSYWANDALYLSAGNNLGDVADVATARTNLGLKNLAHTADYADLLNVPVNVSTFANDAVYLTSANDLSDLTSAAAARTNLGLKTVAATGAYSDLTGVPVNVSQFTNDSQYITSANNLSDVGNVVTARSNLGLKAVANTGSYSDLLNKPFIPSVLTDLAITDGTNGQVLSTDGSGGFSFQTIAQSFKNLSDTSFGSTIDANSFPVYNGTTWVNKNPAASKVALGLSALATSGDWSDVQNAPTSLSAFTNDPQYITAANNLSDLTSVNTARANLGLHVVSVTGTWDDLINKPTVVSRFSNDEGYIKSANNLSELTDAAIAKNNLNLHTVATSGSYNDLANLPDLSLKADLVAGKIPVSQIPSIALTEYLGVAADQAAMLALGGQKGDWCNRTDSQSTWIITGSNSANLADWTELQYPADTVNSVNGQTGAVLLTASDVGALAGSTYIPSVGTDFDAVGTDNSTDVSLSGSYDYLTITGQQISLNQIDLSTDVVGLLPYTSLDNAPSNVSHFANDANYLTAGSNLSDLVNAATARTNLGLKALASTADYADLLNTPYIPQAGVDFDSPGSDNSNDVTITGLDYISIGGASGQEITVNQVDLATDVVNNLPVAQVSGLHNVATSGDYGDLVNVPDLTNRHDVFTANLQTGQFLAWDSDNNRWTNASIGYGGSVVIHGNTTAANFDYTLAGQTDVLVGSPQDGQVLMFDSSVNQWVNQYPPTDVELGYARTTVGADTVFDFTQA